MLLPDRQMSSISWRGCRMAIAAVAAATMLAGCTATPLYQSNSVQTGYAQQQAQKLSQVAIAEVDTRHEQEVRNHLIFLLGGGAGDAVNPTYLLKLDVSSSEGSAAKIQIPLENDGRPSAGTVTLSGSYRLIDALTGEDIHTGSRSVSAAFDRPRQEYAVLRAVRDAENRAARELAEIIRLDVAQNL